jgi:hypothetical protein
MAVDRARSPGEVQDRALVAFEIVLGSSGWRVGHFGVETIIEDLTQVKDDLGPRLAVLAATTSERFAEVAPQLSLSSAWRPLPLPARLRRRTLPTTSVRVYSLDPVTSAEHLPSRQMIINLIGQVATCDLPTTPAVGFTLSTRSPKSQSLTSAVGPWRSRPI